LNLKKFKFSQNLKKSKIKPKFDNEELQESKVPENHDVYDISHVINPSQQKMFGRQMRRLPQKIIYL